MTTPIITNIDLQTGFDRSPDGWHVLDWYDGPLTEARAVDAGPMCGDQRVMIEIRQMESLHPYTTKTITLDAKDITAITKLLAAGRLALNTKDKP